MNEQIRDMIDEYNERSLYYILASEVYPRHNGSEFLEGKAKAYAEMVDDLIKLQEYV